MQATAATVNTCGGIGAADCDCPAVVAVPCRDPVAPPDLTGNAPVFDVSHPFEVGIFPTLGNEPNPAVFHDLNRRPGERPGFNKPLRRKIGLNHGPATVALAK